MNFLSIFSSDKKEDKQPEMEPGDDTIMEESLLRTPGKDDKTYSAVTESMLLRLVRNYTFAFYCRYIKG